VPFEAERSVAVARKHIYQQPVSAGALSSAVTPELDAISMRALEKAPACRFPDAEAFIASLEQTKAKLELFGGAEGGVEGGDRCRMTLYTTPRSAEEAP
jgi:hypothetical protein